jgi:hypothetical protein
MFKRGELMELSNFTVGKKYDAKKVDFAPPDGSPTVPGEAICFTVLEPANAENHKAVGGEDASPAHVAGWAEFLRVQNDDTGRVHLLHPNTVESAVEAV